MRPYALFDYLGKHYLGLMTTLNEEEASRRNQSQAARNSTIRWVPVNTGIEHDLDVN